MSPYCVLRKAALRFQESPSAFLWANDELFRKSGQAQRPDNSWRSSFLSVHFPIGQLQQCRLKLGIGQYKFNYIAAGNLIRNYSEEINSHLPYFKIAHCSVLI